MAVKVVAAIAQNQTNIALWFQQADKTFRRVEITVDLAKKLRKKLKRVIKTLEEVS